MQNFHRNRTVQQCVFGLEYVCHPASGEMLDDAVPVGKYTIFHGSEGTHGPH
jgi:hypothetical protein